MTQRHYYDNPLVLEFEANVVDILPQENGTSHVILDQTYFYPTGGGQSNDTGMLGNGSVVDVLSENGSVIHVVKGAIAGGTVQGQIDRDRRWRNMQAHTGQHILSAAFIRAFEAETVAVRMNPIAPSTVDITRSDLTREQIRQVELLANTVMMENRPVKSYFLSPDDARLGDLRRAVKFDKVSGDVRIVEIEDWDMSACAGTHFPTTGMLGLLKILKVENYKGGSRVHFVVGYEALAQFEHYYEVATDVSNLLSAGTGDIVGLVQKLQDEKQALSKQLAAQQEALLGIEKDQLLANAHKMGNVQLVSGAFDNRASDALKTLVNLLCEESQTVVVFANKQGESTGIIIGAAADAGVHAGNLLKELVAQFNGRGGGSTTYAQGMCQEIGDVSALLEAAAERMNP